MAAAARTGGGAPSYAAPSLGAGAGQPAPGAPGRKMNRVTSLSHRRHRELLDVQAPLPIIIAFHIPE